MIYKNLYIIYEKRLKTFENSWRPTVPQIDSIRGFIVKSRNTKVFSNFILIILLRQLVKASSDVTVISKHFYAMEFKELGISDSSTTKA